MTELILGTAQFGAGYGITNSAGRLDDATVGSILATAASAGIELFDTAPDYGDAQSRIGQLRPAGAIQRYVSKFGLPADVDTTIDFGTLFQPSLDALGVSSLYGLLFHRVSDLRDARAIEVWQVLRAARETGQISHLGASIYDSEDLAVVVERFPDLDLLQIPGNILDRRLLDHPDLRKLHERGVEVHVRSAYLQGLLLASPKDVPDDLADLRTVIAQLRELADTEDRSILELVLGFLKNHEVVDAVLVGALAPTELQATVSAWNKVSADLLDFNLAPLDPRLLDPRQWQPRSKP